MNKLSSHAFVSIGLMLFALFFGAGNLIFPVFLGQNAGSNTVLATAGFLFTGVGLPLLGIVAMCYSGCGNLQALAGRVHPVYGLIFTILLYLTIGPCFAIPRTATVTFEMSVAPFISTDMRETALYISAFLFFVISWWFSITPSKLVVRISQIITPVLLFFLAVLIVQSLLSPMGAWQAPTAAYAAPGQALAQGFLDGYNTLDALASLVFAILVVQAVQQYGAKTEVETALATLKSGLVAALCLAVIYVFLCNIGADSVTVIGMQENGAPVLVKSAQFYFGNFGAVILGIIVFLACLTTSVGLLTSCGAYFSRIFPMFRHAVWVTIFAVFSFGVALFGLSTIIVSAIPVLMFLYPLTISLMILTFLHKLFGGHQAVYVMATLFTFVPSLYDGLRTAKVPMGGLETFMSSLPLHSYGLVWVPFTLAGLIIGWIIAAAIPRKNQY